MSDKHSFYLFDVIILLCKLLSNSILLFCYTQNNNNRAALDGVGSSLEVAKYTEKLVPSTRFVAVDGVAPVVATTTNFIAPNASVIGDVTIGNNSR